MAPRLVPATLVNLTKSLIKQTTIFVTINIGSIDHLETDVNSLAEWEVDFIKMDGCNVENDKMIEGYIKFGDLMNKTGRPIMYSCSWPAYFEYYRKPPMNVRLEKNLSLSHLE
jgi:alpha-galactosidase